MKEHFLKNLLNKKNIILTVVSIILAILCTIAYSIALYSNNISTLKISLDQNDIISEIVVNNNKLSLTDFSNDRLLIEEQEGQNVLVCNNEYDLVMNISLIDDVSISFNTNNVELSINDNICKIENNTFVRENSILDIVKRSISKNSILIFGISFIVLFISLCIFIKVLDKINQNKVNVWGILLFVSSIFVIYLSNIYFLMSINKLLTILPAIILLLFIGYYFRFKFNEWQTIFLCIISVIGTMMIFIIPPGNVPDEPAHYIRSYADSSYSIKNDDGSINLPTSIDELFHKYTHNVHNLQEKYCGKSYITELLKNPGYFDDSFKKATYTNTKNLSFLPYLPSAIVNFIGRLCDLPVLILFLLCRLINFVISTVLCYFAIKTTPRFKKIFVLVALMPIFIQQAAGIDMDYLTNSVTFIFVATILKYKYNNYKIGVKQLICLSSLGIALGLCKFGYFPLLLLILLIPNKNFRNKKEAVVFKILFVLIPIIVSYFCNFGSVSVPNDKTDYYTIEKVLSNPINSIEICLRTLFKRFDLDIFRGLIDGFGWSTKFHYSFFLWTIASIYIIMLFVNDEKKDKIDIKDRVVMLGVFAIIFALLYAIAFTEWTPIELNFINGLQSRYFIPIVLLLYIAISNNILTLNVKDKYKFYTILLSIAQVLSIASILMGFY